MATHTQPAHLRMRQDMHFHYFGADLLSAPVDAIFNAAFGYHVPARMETNEVSCFVESIRCECFGIVLGSTIIPTNSMWAAAPNLSHFSLGYFRSA